MSTPLSTRIIQEHVAAAALFPAQVVGGERRARAMEVLAARGLPSVRDDNWKYTNLRALEKVRFAPAAQEVSPAVSVADMPPAIDGYLRFTFVDGVFAPELSSDTRHQGVSFRSLRAAPGGTPTGLGGSAGVGSPVGLADAETQRPSGRFDPGDERFALLNDAFATDGAAVHVSARTDCPTCLEFVFVARASSQTAASYPRLELHVEADARVGVIERHISVGGEASFVNGSVSVNIGRGAVLNHYRVQQVNPAALWFDTLKADISQDGIYQLRSVNLGGLSARSTLQIRLAGERAEVGVHVVSVADHRQVQDTFVHVDHIAPRTRTEQNFRGIAAGRSRVAFNGKVVVCEGANGADSRQSLRGLLAGPEAEIDARPQLEIYTDDVKCSHGATAGKLDETMLFYLLSRGLERDTAQQLLKWAFLQDIVAKIDVPELRRQIEQSIAGQMQEATALKELL